MDGLTYGTDPEYFSVDSNNEIISPALLEHLGFINSIPDDRSPKEQMKHPFYYKDGKYIWMGDGAAWELTLLQPYTDPILMMKDLKEAHQILKQIISGINYDGGLKFFCKPACKINPNLYLPYLETSERVAMGFIFGCDKDWDAIEAEYKGETFDVSAHEWRYGGGHLHTGFINPKILKFIKDNIMYFVQLSAIYNGTLCLSESPYPEEELQRVYHYGRPGRYRPQKWGVEYRTPSNSWTINDEKLLGRIFTASEKITEILLNDKQTEYINEYLRFAIRAINNADQSLAKQIVTSLGI